MNPDSPASLSPGQRLTVALVFFFDACLAALFGVVTVDSLTSKRAPQIPAYHTFNLALSAVTCLVLVAALICLLWSSWWQAAQKLQRGVFLALLIHFLAFVTAAILYPPNSDPSIGLVLSIPFFGMLAGLGYGSEKALRAIKVG
jgi:glucan phosphoethanolaminetransferase (alkaline phosphatase superfamily)